MDLLYIILEKIASYIYLIYNMLIYNTKELLKTAPFCILIHKIILQALQDAHT